MHGLALEYTPNADPRARTPAPSPLVRSSHDFGQPFYHPPPKKKVVAEQAAKIEELVQRLAATPAVAATAAAPTTAAAATATPTIRARAGAEEQKEALPNSGNISGQLSPTPREVHVSAESDSLEVVQELKEAFSNDGDISRQLPSAVHASAKSGSLEVATARGPKGDAGGVAEHIGGGGGGQEETESVRQGRRGVARNVSEGEGGGADGEGCGKLGGGVVGSGNAALAAIGGIAFTR